MFPVGFINPFDIELIFCYVVLTFKMFVLRFSFGQDNIYNLTLKNKIWK